MKKINPFDECPVYETKSFILSLISLDDAEDLFVCYSDPITLSHMNNDNCSGEFMCPTVDVMRNAINSWLAEYENRTFVRWSVKDKESKKVVGTIEIAPLPWGRWFFGEEKPNGILRIDLLSDYEKEEAFIELVGIIASELANDFEVNQVIMKAVPEEVGKVNALIKNNFQPYVLTDFPFKHYYIR